jgi:hypothetical protein
MGVEQSRDFKLPTDIDEQYHIFQPNWNAETIGSDSFINGSTKGKTTLKSVTLHFAGELIGNYFKNQPDGLALKILEPFAGNGVATKIIHDEIIEQNPNVVIKSTDVQDLSEHVDETSHPVEFGINSVDTVHKYAADGYNVLMMVSPPPASMNKKVKTDFGDYFAIKAWEQVPSAKYICFVGELGASDGCKGLYDYLCNDNKTWSLDYRQTLASVPHVLGGTMDKDLFVFIKRNE